MTFRAFSTLFDEKTFYSQFLKDLSVCKREVIIESPFITTERMKIFRPVFKIIIAKGIKVFVITRHPHEHENEYRYQAEAEVAYFEHIGVQALLCLGNHHRKLAILDREIVWEGSLNILSQSYSREIMRRIPEEQTARETFEFLRLGKYI